MAKKKLRRCMKRNVLNSYSYQDWEAEAYRSMYDLDADVSAEDDWYTYQDSFERLHSRELRQRLKTNGGRKRCERLDRRSGISY